MMMQGESSSSEILLDDDDEHEDGDEERVSLLASDTTAAALPPPSLSANPQDVDDDDDDDTEGNNNKGPSVAVLGSRRNFATPLPSISFLRSRKEDRVDETDNDNNDNNDEQDALLLMATKHPSLPLPQQDTSKPSSTRGTTMFWNKRVNGGGDTSSSSSSSNMQVFAAAVLWLTVVSLAGTVVWYSYELFNHGTDPHLIAWFSAGAFVLLGFPISMWGILGHLTHYNAPNIQVYIVRVLWMVPIYSVQSWLAMRFTEFAIFFETIRDCYESYVLYSFTQFLIEVLGGEDALILLLKDKSPTRGVHMWGMQWCLKPWLMGQPLRRENQYHNHHHHHRPSYVEQFNQVLSPSRTIVHWKSPFFSNCKVGVLQYVLLKLICALLVVILEYNDLYKEGQFDWQSGYLYICILTNLSQCWALYCLIFFYYATKTELSSIRPVGKFLSVKALVFFTWWQSVFISVLYQMDMIPNYSSTSRPMSSDDVAKGIQDYLIVIEMFIAAVVHTFVFPHSEFSVAAVRARANALSRTNNPSNHHRLGRRRKQQHPPGGRAGGGLLVVDGSDNIELGKLDKSESNGEDYDTDDERVLMNSSNNPGFLRAFMDSAIPRDLSVNTMNMMRGEYNYEKKTLLHHAAVSDQYDLFTRMKRKETDSG